MFFQGCVVGDVDYDDAAETVTLCWGTTFPIGKAILSMGFYGAINDKLKVCEWE